ncbi:predicted protein [Nematostella vectensis]|uniref:Uncharacterized protein n=1 Tax=Nematostella vectensis TaxID=45351 RepID=A7TCE1_NEMVE|nr:predicted protein [Nematostella vectensis]|eukprot:XP_001618392.1 hypothetical protein NEMVEDRAFT_v1g225202 [Nematostella vectensis]
MRIIPAIDIIDGKCVRLSKGDYDTKKIYNENPLEVAKSFEAHGIQYLHLVDLDGAKSSKIINHKILEQIATKTSLKIDFGGGLKSNDDLRIAFESGANQITGGSIAVKNPELFKNWITQYGTDKIILGADANNRKIAISGWLEESKEEVIPFIQNYQNEGISYVICTDIAKDGMLEGPSFELYQDILNQCPNVKLIASGGIATFDELPKLAELGCEGTIIGKAIYEDTCWQETNNQDFGFISKLEKTIKERKENANSETSYVANLFAKGMNKIAQKVGEEAVEVVIEAKDNNDDLFLSESADLLFHYLILLQAKGYQLNDVVTVLKSREK